MQKICKWKSEHNKQKRERVKKKFKLKRTIIHRDVYKRFFKSFCIYFSTWKFCVFVSQKLFSIRFYSLIFIFEWFSIFHFYHYCGIDDFKTKNCAYLHIDKIYEKSLQKNCIFNWRWRQKAPLLYRFYESK